MATRPTEVTTRPTDVAIVAIWLTTVTFEVATVRHIEYDEMEEVGRLLMNVSVRRSNGRTDTGTVDMTRKTQD